MSRAGDKQTLQSRGNGLARGVGHGTEWYRLQLLDFVSSSKGSITKTFSREHHALVYILQAPPCPVLTSVQPALGPESPQDAQARRENSMEGGREEQPKA